MDEFSLSEKPKKMSDFSKLFRGKSGRGWIRAKTSSNFNLALTILVFDRVTHTKKGNSFLPKL